MHFLRKIGIALKRGRGSYEFIGAFLANEIIEMNENGVRLQTIGNMGCQKNAKKAFVMLLIKPRQIVTLVLALNYSSVGNYRNGKDTFEQDKNKEISESEITDDLISDHLTTRGIPDPELLIRTSGERRVSNFLLWQIAYTEFVFLDIFWPDFGRSQFIEAIYDFQNRERRFGMVSEQINTIE